MDNFKIFLEREEEEKNVKETLAKLPKSHQKLLDGYKFKFTPHNTLKNDNGHIGYIHQDKIVVAAPWHYSRSFVFLHECAHLFWEKVITPKQKKDWKDLLSKTKKDQQKSIPEMNRSALDQDDEEIFCMVFAATYAKHPPITYTNKAWQDFIINLN